jgi:signal transduction histidine kinase
MRSLRSRLWVLWALAAVASVGVGVLLVQLYEQSATAEIGHAEAVVANACDTVQARYAFYVRGWDGGGASYTDPALRNDLAAVVADALFESPDLEGGIWQSELGSIAALGPAGRVARILPIDAAAIAEASPTASDSGQVVIRTFDAPAGQTVLAVCSLKSPLPGLTAWVRTLTRSGQSFIRLRLGLALLLFLVLGMSFWLSWLMLIWSRHVGRIEATLAQRDSQVMPALARTGERELDRIVDALNEAGRRLEEGRERAQELARRVAAAERLASLGRVAAGVAHEIRNPLASMLLKAENALAGDDERRCLALTGMLGQITRLNTLVGELLAFAQPRQPVLREVRMAEFLAERVEEHRDAVEAAGATLVTHSEVAAARLDPDLVTRVLNNLIGNAIQHAKPGTQISVSATRVSENMCLTVADTGVGIDPQLRGTLFEPFVTGRPEGTGLGLAIAREIAEAHGGRLVLRHPGGTAPGDGAVFLLELPWLSS